MAKGRIIASFGRGKFPHIRNRLFDMIDEKNPNGSWESPAIQVTDFGGSFNKVGTVVVINLLEKLVDDKHLSREPLRVYEYKDGLRFKSGDELNITIRPACQENFYRDWEQDGICVEERRGGSHA